MGIVHKHPIYKFDQGVQTFFNQLSFKVPDVPSRQDALTTQIPTADALLQGTSEGEQILVQKASNDIQKLISFLTALKDHLRSVIKQKLGKKHDWGNAF